LSPYSRGSAESQEEAELSQKKKLGKQRVNQKKKKKKGDAGSSKEKSGEKKELSGIKRGGSERRQQGTNFLFQGKAQSESSEEKDHGSPKDKEQEKRWGPSYKVGEKRGTAPNRSGKKNDLGGGKNRLFTGNGKK